MRLKGTPANSTDPLTAPVPNALRREVGSVQVALACTGAARVKRLIYPPGFRWSIHMKPLVGTEFCKHAHVGFLARGHVHVEYADGCTMDLVAPSMVAIEPGHDAWVVGDEPAVLIQFDFERETVRRIGMPEYHRHA